MLAVLTLLAGLTNSTNSASITNFLSLAVLTSNSARINSIPLKLSLSSRNSFIHGKASFATSNPHKEYRPVPKKATANSRSNKKKGVEPTNEIRANSTGSSFYNVDNSITSTTLTIDKIGKYENQIIDGQATLVDEDDNPLKRDSYGNGDYDDDPYDDDMYEGRDISEEIQTICDNLDIRVRGSNNDVDVLNVIPCLNDLKYGKAHQRIPFVANNMTYKWRYYLTSKTGDISRMGCLGSSISAARVK
ncbi:reverse transcriptase domain-containing protein [Tanacetum coccineum]